MFLGHISTAVAAKPIVPKINLWILIAAAQLIDIAFFFFAALGIEGVREDARPLVYGGFILDIMYSHSLLFAVVLSILVYFLAARFWKSARVGLVLGVLVFSHWLLDLIVHHPDMTFLPGNVGDFHFLGLSLWARPVGSLSLEVSMAVTALIVFYFFYSRHQETGKSRMALTALVLFILGTTVFHLLQMP